MRTRQLPNKRKEQKNGQSNEVLMRVAAMRGVKSLFTCDPA